MTLFPTIVLAFGVLFAGYTAWIGLSAPRGFASRLGLTTVGRDGLNEVRAQYGGFFLAVAVVGALALAGLLPRLAGLVLYAAVFGGLIFGRLASLGLDRGAGPHNPTIRALFVIDSVGFAASLAALALESRI